MAPIVAGLKENLGLQTVSVRGVSPETHFAQVMVEAAIVEMTPTVQPLPVALLQSVDEVGHCERCHTFSRDRICSICLDPTRDARVLCVVETPADQSAVERTGAFRGLYFVLMGKLSPLDGIGPKEIGLQKLFDRATDGAVREVILATNFTAEGEATAHVIGEALRLRGLQVTRLARGVPAGSELEYVDRGTLAHAFAGRRDL